MPVDLTEAVRIAADRLDTCDFVLFCDNAGPEFDEEDYDEAVNQLMAPFCGCNGCVAREAIHAAFVPIITAFLSDLFSYNANPDDAPCCIVGKRAWQYHVALMDISEGADNPKDLALKALGMKKEDK